MGQLCWLKREWGRLRGPQLLLRHPSGVEPPLPLVAVERREAQAGERALAVVEAPWPLFAVEWKEVAGRGGLAVAEAWLPLLEMEKEEAAVQETRLSAAKAPLLQHAALGKAVAG